MIYGVRYSTDSRDRGRCSSAVAKAEYVMEHGSLIDGSV